MNKRFGREVTGESLFLHTSYKYHAYDRRGRVLMCGCSQWGHTYMKLGVIGYRSRSRRSGMDSYRSLNIGARDRDGILPEVFDKEYYSYRR